MFLQLKVIILNDLSCHRFFNPEVYVLMVSSIHS
jgi:hypothetical protein